jgi:hypothetical protein
MAGAGAGPDAVAVQEALVVVKDASAEDDSLFERLDGNADSDLAFQTDDRLVARHRHREVGRHALDGESDVDVLGVAPAHECVSFRKWHGQSFRRLPDGRAAAANPKEQAMECVRLAVPKLVTSCTAS